MHPRMHELRMRRRGRELGGFAKRSTDDLLIAQVPGRVGMDGVGREQGGRSDRLEPDVREIVEVSVEIIFAPDPRPKAFARDLPVEAEGRC